MSTYYATDEDNDIFNGTAFTYYAGDGNDQIGKDNDDFEVYGGNGNDTLYQNGDFYMDAWGGNGNDWLQVANSTVNGSYLYGEGGNDYIVGSFAVDYIEGGYDIDSLHGGGGDDIIYGGDGDDGNIVIVSGTGNVNFTVEGLAGLWGDAGNDYLDGGRGNDYMYGGSDNDILLGGEGNDLLDGGAGIDKMSGGSGDDSYYVDDVADRVIEASNDGTDTVFSSISYALGANIEDLTLTGSDNINGVGNSVANTIIGNSGDNVIDGLAGPDTMIGGAGSDTYYVDNAGDSAIERNGAVGTDLVIASVSYSLYGSELENLTLTGSDNLNGTGNSIANVIIGNSGDNVLDGAAGADRMIGGAGSDTYYVDRITDKAVEDNGAVGTDLVIASVSYSLGGSELENLTLTGSDNLNGTGNSIANTIIGNIGSNVLNGLGGADTMIGGAGSDTYYVDNAGDRAIERNGAVGTDLVIASVSYSLGGSELENLTLTGSGSLSGTGNSIANVIIGNSGANVLNGLGGADRLSGGSGSDTFVFSTALGAGNVDRITDFSAVDDTIQLSKAIFTALSAGTLNEAAFKDLSESGATVDASDRILYNKTTGALSYDADGSGSQAAVQFATIDTKVTLTHADFIVV